ncbi:type II toxin-antitoxin system Phd/YefM family antitoxin [Mycolicibacter icosiumassiliensis]|uniref:type II toxin-antitoxin system Phd/YefM family antitoxin n=1 Tax=Mycolicibacter icosiumassiliensis TaxID=1792835 RepID=UPI00082F2E0C|nr:type II toxin-antitoxin system prevent-host-death family antitoxin [Mycolicibacter icosiumassiliensis]
MTKSTVLRVGVHEAKTRLSELLRLIDGGQEIEIARGGEPVAKLVPIRSRETRRLGIDEGVYAVPDDFDAPLPDDVLADFDR